MIGVNPKRRRCHVTAVAPTVTNVHTVTGVHGLTNCDNTITIIQWAVEIVVMNAAVCIGNGKGPESMNPFERRARELMLNKTDTDAYLRLLQDGERSEYEVKCPGCDKWMQTYESVTLTHVRTCKKLRREEEEESRHDIVSTNVEITAHRVLVSMTFRDGTVVTGPMMPDAARQLRSQLGVVLGHVNAPPVGKDPDPRD